MTAMTTSEKSKNEETDHGNACSNETKEKSDSTNICNTASDKAETMNESATDTTNNDFNFSGNDRSNDAVEEEKKEKDEPIEKTDNQHDDECGC